MAWKNPNHPVWRLLQTVVYLVFAAFIMWANASDFDETELKALTWIGGVMFAGEGIKRVLVGSQKSAD
jgi:hypothetical protein